MSGRSIIDADDESPTASPGAMMGGGLIDSRRLLISRRPRMGAINDDIAMRVLLGLSMALFLETPRLLIYGES